MSTAARPASTSKTRVVILFGGRSAEHEVSILSARNIAAALDRSRFELRLIGIDKRGRWHQESEATLVAAVGDPKTVHLDPSAPVCDATILTADDVVFPILHGTYGEDGSIQGALDFADIAYVGAGVLGSAIGMDKDVAKRLLRDAGLPIVPYQLVTARDFARDPAGCVGRAGALGYPQFCKPANAGSSVGVSRVKRAADLDGAIRAALAFDRKVLLERAVDAREVECAVLGNDDPLASIPGEIWLNHKDGFYSYAAKYQDEGTSEFRVPAQLSPELTARVQALAVATFRALELRGMARVDFFLDRRDGAFYVNEVNTLPGFTALSGYPKMWAASGLPIDALVTRLVELAIEARDARRALSLG